MLTIYYADALTDKEKYIFDQIDPARRTILLVPDQFSLQAEKDALEMSGRKALLELMVTDFNALGHKIVHALEGHDPNLIDKYGRHMLLSVLIDQMDEQLTVFRGRGRGNSFADQMNTMISELKRYEIGPDQLEEVIRTLKAESADPKKAAGNFLVLKLEDTLQIYRAYEEAIEGIYQDSEDYITYYADRIPESDLVRGADVWIYGFDSFTPKNLLVIRRLLETAAQVSVVLTYEDPASGRSPAAKEPAAAANPSASHRESCDMIRSLTQGGGMGLFRLTDQMVRKLEEAAELAGAEHQRKQIPADLYPRRSIWEGEALSERIRLARLSGPYEEAESAAAMIQTLVRDEGYRYGEIAVLCNDMDGRGRAIGRAFERWDIPAFADQKRKALHQPVVSFLLSFLDVLAGKSGEDGILGMIKSGLLGWSAEDEALLENYVKEFRIRGSRWKKEFTWNGGTYTDEELERVNRMRAFLVSVCERARDSIGRRNTAAEKVAGLAGFLQDDFAIRDRISAILERQQNLQLPEGAAETAQIWNAICGIFDQVTQIIGEKRVSNVLLRDMITAGLESLEIGLVPASSDCVIVGTLQRTRPGRIRALLVTGANAGLLPLDATDEGLLSRREKERLEEMQLEFAGRQRIAQMEEQLAIYRMFSLPEEFLYVSCAQSDEGGGMLRPSEVFRRLEEWQPNLLPDLNERPLTDRIGSRRASLPYLAEALRRDASGQEEPEQGWTQVLDWYREHDPIQTGRLMRGIHFDNHREALGEAMADALYRGDRDLIEASASRLETFSGCPFAHFIQYGLRAREERLFEVGGREIGDVYHQCMMEFSREMEEGREAGWQTVTEDQCRNRIARILEDNTEGYREGLFAADEYSRFRMARIAEICGDIAWALVCQVRQGSIRQMYFEEPFGRRSGPAQIPPVEVEACGTKVRIRGIIDRLDVLGTENGGQALRIIDYKTGNNEIHTEDFESGYKLQLMVYMDAALQGEYGGGDGSAAQNEPAGVFYFKIRDFNIDGDDSKGIPEDAGELERRMRRFYRMEGVVINDPAKIGAMDAAVDGTDQAESIVIPVKYNPKKECYEKASGGTLLETEEFQQLMEVTNQQVSRICGEMLRGEIDAVPKRETKKDRDGNRISACRFCGYQSICSFDPAIRGCRYEDV